MLNAEPVRRRCSGRYEALVLYFPLPGWFGYLVTREGQPVAVGACIATDTEAETRLEEALHSCLKYGRVPELPA